MDELSFYNLILLEKNKKEIKNTKVYLNADLNELITEIEKLDQ
jgi:hypothetical protein